jgi:predicted nucleic acid-binding Zn ribbon protein
MESLQKVNDTPLVTCPECKKDTLKKGFGGGSTSFRFKGSGFYITDYKDKKKPNTSSKNEE